MRFAGNFHPEWGYLAPAPNFMRTARIVAVATAIGATAGAAVVLSLVERPAPGAVADAGKALVVVRSLVQPAEAAASSATAATPATVTQAMPAVVAPPAAPAQVQARVQANVQVSTPPSAQPAIARQQPSPSAPLASAKMAAPAASDSSTTSTPAAPASVAALAEIPPAAETPAAQSMDDVNATPDLTAAQKNAAKKHRGTGLDAQHGPQTNGQANGIDPKKRTASNERGIGPMLRHIFNAHARSSYYPN